MEQLFLLVLKNVEHGLIEPSKNSYVAPIRSLNQRQIMIVIFVYFQFLYPIVHFFFSWRTLFMVQHFQFKTFKKFWLKLLARLQKNLFTVSEQKVFYYL